MSPRDLPTKQCALYPSLRRDRILKKIKGWIAAQGDQRSEQGEATHTEMDARAMVIVGLTVGWKVWLRVEAGFRMGDMIKGRGRSGVASGSRVSLG